MRRLSTKARWANAAQWSRTAPRSAKIPIVFVNLVGGNDGIIFDGASIVADCEGKIILQAPPFEEFFGTVDLDCGVRDERCLPGDDIETIHERAGARYSRLRAQEPIQTAVLGLSGGHRFRSGGGPGLRSDGCGKCVGVMMPSPYSSRSSIDDSVELGRRLGMTVIEHPIYEAFEVLLKQMNLPAPSVEKQFDSRRESAIASARKYPDDDLELRRSPVAIDRKQVGTRPRLLHALRRHEWRTGGNWRRLENRSLRARELSQSRAKKSFRCRLSKSVPPPNWRRDNSTINRCRRTTNSIACCGCTLNRRQRRKRLSKPDLSLGLCSDILNRVESPANEFKRRQLPPTLIISRNAIGIGRRRPVTHHYRRERLNCGSLSDPETDNLQT